MKKDLELYPGHIFRAKWQQKQMSNCINNLRQGTVAMVMDFSENYGCVFQSEVQSGFFDRNQVTIHPIMAYYRVKEEETEEEYTVKHAIIGISEDNKHDADAVLEFENRALDVVSKEIDIVEVHEWTDGSMFGRWPNIVKITIITFYVVSVTIFESQLVRSTDLVQLFYQSVSKSEIIRKKNRTDRFVIE
ncbi:hypothetical protein KUTeg_022022 [Tegillarca granosa]|uniref:Uncharacterized protein n=1 Tax=Tegillarca granosa TaxID=220873 RepID=A0ABQ9E520_TEGGR|nr:hypothetical protein KUTeg_022022 [Tegillarca granosa]